jgi:hypothetical protein
MVKVNVLAGLFTYILGLLLWEWPRDEASEHAQYKY